MILEQNNVQTYGSGARTLVFAHGYGCDQNMWRPVADAMADRYRVVLFDYIGFGQSDLSAYASDKYATLQDYATDVIKIARELELQNAVFVGHSVSAMIGALASISAPDLFDDLIMVGPSPYYMKDGDYNGGFSPAEIEEMLEFLDHNHLGWSQAMAPAIMGNTDRPELGETLTNSFCATDPQVARDFAKVTFLSDCRDKLPEVKARTLILQCVDDIIAPEHVGAYVHANIAGSTFKVLDASGHCPNLSAPHQVTAAIEAFL
ncbi:hydrolase [Litorimonas cladophorae]|uniref:Hydrolase n=1 Tax=Litorimonas cladophorae TaxID=1220491 RepID=A0A918KLY9_9PROT|nr:alpha/beta hydrolase [Litorimonas cladophorae]GGX65953.1 hydrolase [Litorimonas cladophorae]